MKSENDLINKLNEIKNSLPKSTIGELRFIENPFLPENIVIVSTKMMNNLKNIIDEPKMHMEP